MKDNIGRSEIRIFKYEFGDNFGQIVSVLCHEMIHAYDRYFGELKKIVQSYVDKDESPEIIRTKTTQFVGSYDVHGRYFMSIVNKISQYGFNC